MDEKPAKKKQKRRGHIDNVSLTSLDGKPTTLKQLAGDAGVAIGFLHGTYCPACMQQLARANRYATTLAEHGVKLVWLLQDKPTTISAYRLAAQPPPRYELLADTQPSVAGQFRETDESNAGATDPTLVYLNTDNQLRYVEASENPHAPLHIEELLKAVESTYDSSSESD
jgi:peroxiredoxin